MKYQAAVDPNLIRPQGKWTHLDVSAGGQRFHLVSAGNESSSKLVILLHGFPQYWWAWREVLPLLAASEYRVLAMDLRGFGGSDKPPSDYRLVTLAADVTGVAQVLGGTKTVIVGHGLGGAVAWMCAASASSALKGIVTLSSPHPLGLRSLHSRLLSGAAIQYALMQLPFLPDHALLSGRLVRGLLGSWTGKVYRDKVLSQADRYTKVLQRPLAAGGALKQIRGSWRLPSKDRDTLKRLISIPVLSLQGQYDPIMPAQAFARDSHYLVNSLEQKILPRCGHFLPEEDPPAVAKALLPFIRHHLLVSQAGQQ